MTSTETTTMTTTKTKEQRIEALRAANALRAIDKLQATPAQIDRMESPSEMTRLQVAAEHVFYAYHGGRRAFRELRCWHLDEVENALNPERACEDCGGTFKGKGCDWCAEFEAELDAWVGAPKAKLETKCDIWNSLSAENLWPTIERLADMASGGEQLPTTCYEIRRVRNRWHNPESLLTRAHWIKVRDQLRRAADPLRQHLTENCPE
jgi:hypothetical protein